MTTKELLSLHIFPTSGTPIYKQIVEQIQRLIVGGQILAHDQLPSVRNLAEQLEINPMTVSKAYNALEKMGLLQRNPGIGMTVMESPQGETSVEQRLARLEPSLRNVMSEARQLGIQDHELIAHLQLLTSKSKSS